MRTFVDSFSGSVSELTAKQTRDENRVLRVLAKDPNVSTWDMDTHGLWKTIDKLEKKGMVLAKDAPYPWHKYVVTDSGKKFLKELEAGV